MKNIIKWILFGILAFLAAIGVWTLWAAWPMIQVLVFGGGIH